MAVARPNKKRVPHKKKNDVSEHSCIGSIAVVFKKLLSKTVEKQAVSMTSVKAMPIPAETTSVSPV